MPSQITGVTITPNEDFSTVEIQIGPNGFQNIATASLFQRNQFDAAHLKGNVRLKRIIGGFSGALWSQEFKDAINENGIATTPSDYFSVDFVPNDDGSYNLLFSTQLGHAASEGIVINPADMDADTHDLEMVKLNIGSFLRRAGYTDLTTPAANGAYVGKTAVQAVPLWTFRY